VLHPRSESWLSIREAPRAARNRPLQAPV
jgi:hypothetical protein